MKLAFIIVGLFFLSLTVKSRELNFSEKLIVSNLDRIEKVKNYMESNIKARDLSLRSRVDFYASKKSCIPLGKALETIESSDENYPSQRNKLLAYMLACQNGIMNLSYYFAEQQE